MGELRVPDLGRIEGAVVLAAWLVEDGERVARGQEVVELETSKVTFAVEAPREGILRRLVEEGDEVVVGGILADFA